jgi:ABC-type uncharacterized transport system involved in gliding motility auxiliary subunit
MTSPATFLVVGSDNHTRITSDPAWKAILDSESLEKSTETIETDGDTNLTVVSKGKLGALTFSSIDNKTVFGSSSPSGQFKSPAWVGDTLGC